MSLPPIRRQNEEDEVEENEPLLGAPGANEQPVESTLGRNLFSGTAPLAQIGALILALAVYYSIGTHPIALFSAHPILNVIGVAILLQSTLILQPTHTPEQKRTGAITHSVLNGAAAAFLYAAFVVIVVNKLNHKGTHFESPHAILGLVTYIFLFLQATVGVVQFYFPNLVGGVDNGKALYKYHRAAGYTFVLLLFSTLIAATYTTFNVNVLHIKTWVVGLASALVLAGVIPRVKLYKFGLKPAAP